MATKTGWNILKKNRKIWSIWSIKQKRTQTCFKGESKFSTSRILPLIPKKKKQEKLFC